MSLSCKSRAFSHAASRDLVMGTCSLNLFSKGKDDKDNLGCFVQYRVAFYCAGDEDSLTNFFMLLDSFLTFRVKQYRAITKTK